MLTLITAKPGSGKTQYAIQRFILDLIRDNEKAIAEWKPSEEFPEPPLQRQVFANIKGLDIGAIHALVGGKPVMPSPNDWQECPDGSVVIYDEAQQEHLFPATGKPGLPDDARIARLDTHRHRGFDIVLITQDQALVHHWARKFVNCHLHLARPSGAELMTVHQWSEVQSNPNDFFAKRDADIHSKRMDPSIWKLYKSATVHTHKFEMPKGAKFAIRMFLVLGLIVVGGFAWLPSFMSSAAVAEDKKPPSIMEAVAPLVPGSAPVEPVRVSSINGCASGKHCRCWDFDGQVVDMPEDRCRNMAEGYDPMPINLNRFMASSNTHDGGRAGKSEAPAPRASGAPSGVTTAPAAVGSPRAGDVWGNPPSTLRASGE